MDAEQDTRQSGIPHVCKYDFSVADTLLLFQLNIINISLVFELYWQKYFILCIYLVDYSVSALLFFLNPRYI